MRSEDHELIRTLATLDFPDDVVLRHRSADAVLNRQLRTFLSRIRGERARQPQAILARHDPHRQLRKLRRHRIGVPV